ncbi:MAG: RNA polymerase-associated protein RapA, partial [bacterium]
FGLEVEPHSADTVVVRPGEEMAVTDFPGLPHEGLTGTISRTRALSREGMDFLSWEHPLVAGAMDMLLSSEGGNTALGTIKLPPIKAGTLLIEAIYTLSCAAPKSTQLERYLESPITRVLIDEQGNNLGKALPYEKFSTIVKGVAPAARQQVVKHLRQRVEATIKKSDAVADNIRAELVARAINHMTHELDQEQQRLAELAKLNPAIRQQEVAHIGDIRDDLEDYLGQATMRLDAVRVVIAS